MMLEQLALKKKLNGGFGVIILSMIAGTAFSVIEIRGLTVVVSRAASIHELTEVGTFASDMIGLERAIVLYSIFDDKANVQQYKARLEDSSRAFLGALDTMSAGATSEGAGNTLKTLRARYAAWLVMHNEIIGYLDKQQVDVAQKKVADPSFTAAVDEMRQ